LYVSLGQISRRQRSCLASTGACISSTRVEALGIIQRHAMSLILGTRGTNTRIKGHLTHQLRVQLCNLIWDMNERGWSISKIVLLVPSLIYPSVRWSYHQEISSTPPTLSLHYCSKHHRLEQIQVKRSYVPKKNKKYTVERSRHLNRQTILENTSANLRVRYYTTRTERIYSLFPCSLS
jgi:hypothetical protein